MLGGRPPAASGIFAGIPFKATVAQIEALQAARKAGAGKAEIAKMIESFKGNIDPYGLWTPQMQAQYKEFKRGGSDGPVGDGSKWLKEFSDRLIKELQGK